jgi:hypothetical protein
MSKGTRAYPVRIPDDLMELIEDEVSMRNAHSGGEPWTVVEFIRQMVIRGIRHRKRSRKEGVDSTPLRKAGSVAIEYE